MPKRKHDEISRSEFISNGTTDRALRLQRLQVDGVLNQSKKSLFRSLKVARGFERQKLGRRQKTAKAESNATDIRRLEAEVAALKTLHLASTAEIHLYRSLLKIKSIASASAIPHYVQATIDAAKKPQEVASVNVQARLFKSGPVQVAMTEALKGIRAALGVEELKPNSKKRLRAKDYANDSQANGMDRPVSSEREGSSLSKPPRAQDEDEWSGLSAAERPEDGGDHGVQDDSDENDEYDIYASRLAASSDESSVEEDVQGQNHDRDKLDDMSITEEEEEAEVSSEKDNDDDDHAPEAKHPHPKPINPIKQPPTTTSITTFLPSLSLAGYWSGSDSSSPSSSEPATNNNNKTLQMRKNRMGQQARRALWEKKFGRNANHVKNRAQRDSRGDDDERGRGRGRVAKKNTMTGANSDPIGIRRKGKPKPKPAAGAEEGPLHPSWEAARKAKEQKKMAAVAPFQGKKVVFS